MAEKKSPPPPSHPPKKPVPEPLPPADLSDIEEAIGSSIGPIVHGGSKKQVVERVMTIIESEIFSGPLPHPRHLQAYESICPGLADRLLKMAEMQQSADIEYDKAEQANEHADLKRGMWMGFGALGLLIVAAGATAWAGQTGMAVTFLGTAAVGTVGRFIAGRKNGNGDASEG